MKRVLLLFVALMFCLALIGCGSDSEEDPYSKDKKQLAKLREIIKEGDLEEAKDESSDHEFDEDYYYYIARSEYYIATGEYGEALLTLDDGTNSHWVADDLVDDLEKDLAVFIEQYGEQLKQIREKEREQFLVIKEKLDVLQEQIDTELNAYYNGTSSKIKLAFAAENMSMAGIDKPMCDGMTNEYAEIKDYYNCVKKQIKYMEKFGKEKNENNRTTGDINAKKNQKNEMVLLEKQQEAKESRAEFEECIKSEPELTY